MFSVSASTNTITFFLGWNYVKKTLIKIADVARYGAEPQNEESTLVIFFFGGAGVDIPFFR